MADLILHYPHTALAWIIAGLNDRIQGWLQKAAPVPATVHPAE